MPQESTPRALAAPPRDERTESVGGSRKLDIARLRANLLVALRAPSFPRCCDLADSGHRSGCPGAAVDALCARAAALEAALAEALDLARADDDDFPLGGHERIGALQAVLEGEP